ncbi:MAG: hypothetical protein LBN07_00825 [Christensenellaceae bacterium]|jgi:aspartate kinase|nr:hypothetical protein [Christensenellaceae bacterium]
MKVLKFGGTSLATAQTISRVVDIIKKDADIGIVVVSAPGKRFDDDQKVTDLLYTYFKQYIQFKQGISLSADYKHTLKNIKGRFSDIIEGFSLRFDLDVEFNKIESDIKQGAGVDYAASRGEYLMAKIMAAVLGARHIESAEVFRFKNKTFDEHASLKLIAGAIKNKGLCVMGGFYGATAEGKIVTFSRGGSDLSGAVAARAIGASVYENWTDVEGFFAASPRIIKDPKKIYNISYSDMHKLSFYGAQVLHKDSVSPLCGVNIPINIKSVFSARGSGTVVGGKSEEGLIGLTCKKGYSLIKMSSSMSQAIKLFDDAEFIVSSAEQVLLLTQKGGVADIKAEEIKNISRIALVGGVKPKDITSVIKAAESVAEIIFMSFEGRTLILGVEDRFCETVIIAMYKALFETN